MQAIRKHVVVDRSADKQTVSFTLDRAFTTILAVRSDRRTVTLQMSSEKTLFWLRCNCFRSCFILFADRLVKMFNLQWMSAITKSSYASGFYIFQRKESLKLGKRFSNNIQVLKRKLAKSFQKKKVFCLKMCSVINRCKQMSHLKQIRFSVQKYRLKMVFNIFVV